MKTPLGGFPERVDDRGSTTSSVTLPLGVTLSFAGVTFSLAGLAFTTCFWLAAERDRFAGTSSSSSSSSSSSDESCACVARPRGDARLLLVTDLLLVTGAPRLRLAGGGDGSWDPQRQTQSKYNPAI
jgi:hypothetical protein